MAVKILIQRKIKPGEEERLNEIVREVRSKAMHAEGFISGETLRSIEDSSVHLVISTWKSIEDWNKWIDSPERKAVESQLDAILSEPTIMAPYQYE